MGFVGELKRRNVFRVAVAYAVASWVLVQAADLVLDVLGAPDVILRTVVALLALGFVFAVIFAWAFEITPDGIKRESEVNRDESITRVTGKKLEMVTIGLLVIAISLLALDRFLPESGHQPAASDIVKGSAIVDDYEPGAVEVEIVEKSIAVLPFANRSNQDDDLFFTDGIHDDLLTQLSKIHDLKVISRTSVMEYRGTTKNMRQIGDELEVANILEGGVQKVGDRVRINVQLIEADSDRHLWAETYDRQLTAENIFDLQSEITGEIVRAISIELTPEEKSSLSEVPTQSLAAYEAFLQARKLFYSANYSRQQETLARPLLERAVELDPNYVEAIAMLSTIYGQEYWRGVDTSDDLLKTYRETVDRAMAIGPDSPDALRASANYDYRVDNNYEASRRKLEAALTRMPGNADLHGDLGLSQRRLGLWEDSVDSFKAALQLDPANRFYRALMVETLMGFRQWERVIANTSPLEDANRDELDIQLNRAMAEFNLTGDLEPLERTLATMNLAPTNNYNTVAIVPPLYKRQWDKLLQVLESEVWNGITDNDQHRSNKAYLKGLAYHYLGDEEKARALFEESVSYLDGILASSRQPRAYGGMIVAVALARLGRGEEALALGERIVADNPYEVDALLYGTLVSQLGQVKGLTGDLDGAIAALEESLRTPSSFNANPWDLHYDPAWDFARDDPRFQALAAPAVRVN